MGAGVTEKIMDNRGGKSKYNDHIIDGGGGLETVKNG